MKELMEFLDARHPDILKKLAEKKAFDDEIKASLNKSLVEFRGIFRAEA